MSDRARMLRAALLCLVLAGVTALASCSAGADPNTPPGDGTGGAQEQTIDIGLGAAPANLDMTTTAGAAIPQALMYNLYEGLVKLDGEGNVQPLLAKSWEISDDRMTYTFALQEGVTFSNGDPFTAETVKFSLERVPDWKANTPSNLSAIESVEAVSDTEVEIRLSRPDNHVLFWLATPLGAMFSPNGVDDLANRAIGTGPYVLDNYNRNESLTLRRNPDYWGDMPALDRAALRYYSDANAPMNALRSGDLDAVYQTQASDQVKQFEAQDDFNVQIGSTPGIVVMSMNSQQEPLDDPRVRKAIILGIDREAVNTTATNSYGTVLGAPVPPNDPWYTDMSGEYPYDPDQAEQLLSDAGASELSLQMTVPSLPYAQTISQVVKSDLAKIGITVRLQSQEFPAVWLDRTFTKKDYQLTVINHVEARNIVNYGDPDYYWNYDNPEVRNLLRQAAEAPSEKDFAANMGEAADVLVEDAAANWLYNPPNIVISTASVTGLKADDNGVSLDLTGVGNPS
jgi:peptide/nickel transport system substrate-binding protein